MGKVRTADKAGLCLTLAFCVVASCTDRAVSIGGDGPAVGPRVPDAASVPPPVYPPAPDLTIAAERDTGPLSSDGAKPAADGPTLMDGAPPDVPAIGDQATIPDQAAVIDFTIPDLKCVGSIPAANKLVGHWKADNDMTDASGFGNHGKFVSQGGSVMYAPGHTGDAFVFKNQGWVEIPDAPILNPTSAITVAAWVKLDQAIGSDIISKDGECSNRQYLLAVGLSTLRFRPHVGTASGFHHMDGATVAQTGVWTHVAMTYDSSTGKLLLYVNGSIDATLAVPGPDRCIIQTPEPVRIGGGASCSTLLLPFPGTIDDSRIYDRALTAAEIMALATP